MLIALLAYLGGILERGNGADRIRRVFDELQAFRPLMSWLSDETMLGTGLDRRSAQRSSRP